MRKFQAKEIEDGLAAWDKHALAHASLTVELPFVFGHIAPPHRGRFPPMPWAVQKFLVPVLGLVHRGCVLGARDRTRAVH